MKPRTKLEHRVAYLSLNHILEINNKQKDWAYNNCLEHKAFSNKTSAFCLDCGESFNLSLIKRNKVQCPKCGTKLKVEKTNKRTHGQHTFFAIADIVGEFQVIRNFELKSFHKKGHKTDYFLKSILEYWILPNGKNTIIGNLHNTQGYCDSWSGDWSIRKDNGYYYNKKYKVYPRFYHPDSIFKKEYMKYGINHNLKFLTFLEAIDIAPKNPKVETLLKAKQFSLASIGNGWELNSFWNSIKICLRNKYVVKDVSIYFDYLGLLRHFNKDLRNYKYVCPSNLKKEHDKLVKKKRDIDKKEKLEKQIKEIKESQLNYEKSKSRFFGLNFKDKDLTIEVIQNVKDFMEEGDDLKHCVFTNKYYDRDDSLILSAKIRNTRIETVEVSLSKMEVVQSRGLKNEASEYNKRILRLVQNNMNTINSLTNAI